MFPRLDVDFHLAPFVDERDHFGLAQARVQIGAPHFGKPREFWVRAVRSTGLDDCASRTSILLRPTQALEDHLLLLPNEIEGADKDADPELPEEWSEQWKDFGVAMPHLSYGGFSRYWRHQSLPLAARLDHSDLGDARLYSLEGAPQDAYSYQDPLQLSHEELIDWPTDRLHSYLERQFADRNSQLFLTWQWIQIPRDQRFKAFFARPEWKGFLHLMQFVLVSEALHNPAIEQSGAVWLFLEDFAWELRTASQPPQRCDATRVDAWGKTVLEFYERRENQQPTPYLMSLDYYQSHPLRCSAPSHHEMLEARLQLHAWAREHLPPSRADELIALDDLD